MKKLLSLLVLVLLISSCEEVLEWDEIDHIYYNGDVNLSLSREINEFKALLEMGYNAIEGSLVINGNFNESKLEFLDQLYVVTGSVFITKYENVNIFDNLIEIGESLILNDLLKFDDFHKLRSIQNISFTDCSLLSINGFNNLDSCTRIEIKNHRGQINSFEAFPSLEKADYLHLNLNQRPDSEFSGLENLLYCQNLKLENIGMNALQNLEIIENSLEINGTLGKNSLGSCKGTDTLLFIEATELSSEIFANLFSSSIVDIVDCQEIEDMEWTTMIDSVVQCRIINCNYLYSLDGLEQQSLLDSLVCSQNDSLKNYCSISALNINNIFIRHNAYNPSWLEIQSGACEPEED